MTVLGFHSLEEGLDVCVICMIAYNGNAKPACPRDGVHDFTDRPGSCPGLGDRRPPRHLDRRTRSPSGVAIPAPTPRLAPVTTATLPAKEGIVFIPPPPSSLSKILSVFLPYAFAFGILFSSNPAKVRDPRGDSFLFSNLKLSVQSLARIRRFLLARRVSSFTTCFINTPWQRNRIPPFIKSRSRLSPSWLIVDMCFISTTTSRPRRSALAFSHALLSSAAQGAMSFPSTITRRCLALSTSEIFNIASPSRDHARRTPNLRNRKSLNFQESNTRTRNIEVEEVETVENVEATRRAGDQAYCLA